MEQSQPPPPQKSQPPQPPQPPPPPKLSQPRTKHAVVLVLGDLGRSPRMQYHALSLLEHGHCVTLVGYAGERLIRPLEDALKGDVEERADDALDERLKTLERKPPPPPYHGHLRVLRMTPYHPPRTNILFRLLYYPLRLASLFYCVMHTLWVEVGCGTSHVPHTRMPVDVVLVQNPPSVPTLVLAYLYCISCSWWRTWMRWKQMMGSTHSFSTQTTHPTNSTTTSTSRPRLVIDWHNLGFSMFPSPHQQRVARIYERLMAPLADGHLCVTRAMQGWLAENFNVRETSGTRDKGGKDRTSGKGGNSGKTVKVKVLYDKPPMMFRPTTLEEQHELFGRLDLEEEERRLGALTSRTSHASSDAGPNENGGKDLSKLSQWMEEMRKERMQNIQQIQHIQQSENEEEVEEETLFTELVRRSDGTTKLRLRHNRPALLVSSTSWTPDEDFSILLEAMKKLNQRMEEHSNTTLSTPSTQTTQSTSFAPKTPKPPKTPKILVLVTGKGPLKPHYLPLLHTFNSLSRHISIHTLWLTPPDYPRLLGCATLGISLHTSTSGLDLPMKVLDCFGCGVPVLAMGFACLGELVVDGGKDGSGRDKTNGSGGDNGGKNGDKANGRVFGDADELAGLVWEVLGLGIEHPGDVGSGSEELEKYRRNIAGMVRWRENWEECAMDVIVGDWDEDGAADSGDVGQPTSRKSNHKKID